ncbi:MAG: ornithine cyclodeaminase family protein, partial [Clostridia bacterium]|nr:ornithine cyclodeaminase family protein [Clostridia bacterium]
MLLLSNEEIANMLTIDDCLDVLEQAYRYLGHGQAGNVPRADLLVEIEPGITYGLKTMSGAVPAFQVGAIRLNSDIVHWPTIAGNTRRVKIPAAPGARWVGLVLLFS